MNRKYLVAAALLIASAAPLSAQAVRDGIDAWQRSDYAGAVAIWMPLAERGDPDAEFNLGQAYRLGRGVPTNLAAAKTWFERAANQGHIDAETTLGLLLFQNGEQRDGLRWLRKAADQGEPRALLVYGTALVNGDTVTQDPVLGYAFVSRAAAQGLEPAKQTLGQLDQLLSMEDRKRGTEIARNLAKAAPAPTEEAMTSKPAKMRAAKAKRAKTPPTTSDAPVRAADAVPGVGPAKAPPRRAQTAVRAADAVPSPAPAPTSKPTKSVAIAAEPAPKAPAAAGAPAPARGAWRIQLGAFSQRGNAEALYRKVSGNAALAGRGSFYVAAGAVTRLQVGPFESKGAAGAACSALGVACFPVPAK
jgi:TPR repeat protein